MKEEKGKNIIIGVLLGIIIILIVIIAVVVTKKFVPNDKVEQNNNKTTNNSILEDNSPNTNTEIINSLYTIIGLPTANNEGNACLNNAISNNDYSNNAQNIISWYFDINNPSVYKNYHYNEEKCQNSEECLKAYTAADATFISKEEAGKVYNLYNFKGKIEDYFTEISIYPEEYIFMRTHFLASQCNIKILHDTTIDNTNNPTIKIIDNQQVTEYTFGTNDIENTLNRTVTYYFEMNIENNYNLKEVIVE